MNSPEFDAYRPTTDDRSQKVLLVDPRFADVLAGYFTPATDTLRAQHTLGRLLVATFNKGKQSESHPVEEIFVGGYGKLTAYDYEPSWANGAVSRIVTRSTDREPQIECGTGIFLKRPDDTVLAIGHNTLKNELGSVLLDSNSQTVKLDLGYRMSEIRDQLAQQAEAFFNFE